MIPALPEYSITSLDVIHHCSAEQLLNALPEGCIHLIVTSPPYNKLRDYKGFRWNFEHIAQQAYRVLAPGGVLVWVVGDAVVNGSESLEPLEQALYFKKAVGFLCHDTMIYRKDSAPFTEERRYSQTWEYMFVFSKGVPRIVNLQQIKSKWAGAESWGEKSQREQNGELLTYGRQVVKDLRKMDNVWDFAVGFNKSTQDEIAFEHPATFPEKLAERHILSWSEPGDIVLDFFMGSGTTAKAARRFNRHYIGCDIAAAYVRLTRKRLDTPYTVDMFSMETTRNG